MPRIYVQSQSGMLPAFSSALKHWPRTLDPRGARNYQARKDFEFAKVYRIIYEIRDTELIITVVKIGHRRHVYKSS